MPSDQPCVQSSGSEVLRQYLVRTRTKLNDGGHIVEGMLRHKIMPQVAESIERLSAHAPASKQQEFRQILIEQGVLPNYGADLTSLVDALKQIESAMKTGIDSLKLSRETSRTTEETLNDIDKSPHGESSGTFKHVFTPEHPGTFEDHYVLEEVLGEGSYGTIFKGRAKGSTSPFQLDSSVDSNLSHPLRAIKTVSSSVTPARFEAEVRVQKQLDHPNITKLYEVFKDKIKYYLVLELSTGGELFDRAVEAGGAFSENTCAAYIKQLLAAMNYLHNHNIAHRDIKPENLLLQSKDEDAPLKLIDFGCAKSFTKGEAMTTSLGTPLYIAPEVLSKKYDAKCDIWSCGIITYVLLCGYTPFMGRDEQDLLQQIVSGRFDYPEEDWDDVSDAAKGLISLMLTTNLQVRPTAETLLEHTWLRDHEKKTQGRLPKDLVSRLRSFKMVSQFKKISLSLAAQLSSDEDIKEMQSTFIALDKHKDGILTLSEIAEGLTMHGLNLPVDLAEVIRSIDTDGSGTIDYTEFIGATLSRRQYLREEVLWNVFRTFDLDGDGKIQRNEFEQVVTMSNQTDTLKIFKDTDLNGDDQIDFSEFCAMMRSGTAQS